MTDPMFVVIEHLLKYVLGEMKDLPVQLQAKTIEVDRVIAELSEWRCYDRDSKFTLSFAVVVKVFGDDIRKPCANKRQSHRNNVPLDSAPDYYKASRLVPADRLDNPRVARPLLRLIKVAAGTPKKNAGNTEYRKPRLCKKTRENVHDL